MHIPPHFPAASGRLYLWCAMLPLNKNLKKQIPERHLAVLDPLGVGTANVGATVEMPSTVFEKSRVVTRCLPVCLPV